MHHVCHNAAQKTTLCEGDFYNAVSILLELIYEESYGRNPLPPILDVYIISKCLVIYLRIRTRTNVLRLGKK